MTEASDLYDFDAPEDENELTTNQRFQKLTRLEQLGIYVDEAHHAFGSKLARDMGLQKSQDQSSDSRSTNSRRAWKQGWHKRVCACYNFTGTPYVGKTSTAGSDLRLWAERSN